MKPNIQSQTLSFVATEHQVGDRVTGGDVFGVVPENTLMNHKIMLPPGARGTITYIAPAGDYAIEEKVIEVEFQGQKKARFSLVEVTGAMNSCI